MIHCTECDLCEQGSDGELVFSCDPFRNIKEPECLLKWQLIKLNAMHRHQEELNALHQRFAPMQERLFDHMEREIQEQEEADSWKLSSDEDEDEDRDL